MILNRVFYQLAAIIVGWQESTAKDVSNTISGGHVSWASAFPR